MDVNNYNSIFKLNSEFIELIENLSIILETDDFFEILEFIENYEI